MGRIRVIDYGMGNLRSVLNAFAEIEQVVAADILPYTKQAACRANALQANAGVPPRGEGQGLAPENRHLY